MELSVSERLILLSTLPKEGNVLTMRVLRELRQALEFSAEDLQLFDMKMDGGRVTWNPKKELPKPVEVSPAMRDVIVKALKDLDKAGKVTEQHLALFDKFEVTGA